MTAYEINLELEVGVESGGVSAVLTEGIGSLKLLLPLANDKQRITVTNAIESAYKLNAQIDAKIEAALAETIKPKPPEDDKLPAP